MLFTVLFDISKIGTKFSQDLTGIVAILAPYTRHVAWSAISSRGRAAAVLLRKVMHQGDAYTARHGVIRHPNHRPLDFQVLRRGQWVNGKGMQNDLNWETVSVLPFVKQSPKLDAIDVGFYGWSRSSHVRKDSIQSYCIDVSPPEATGMGLINEPASRRLMESRATCLTAGFPEVEMSHDPPF